MNVGNQWKSRIRTALLVVAVAAACYVAYGFGQLWAEWRQARQPVRTPPTTTVDLNAINAIMPLAGQWSFADLDWDLRSSLVSPNEVGARLDTLTRTVDAGSAAELPDVSEDLVELARSLQIHPVEQGENQVYALDRPDLKARLVVRTFVGKTKVVALAAAFPHSSDDWQLLECTPRDTAVNQSEAAAHLLPLPAGAKRDGGRFTDDGQALLEFVSLRSTADALVSTWRAAGWEVRPSDLGRTEFGYLCARGDEVVYAWSPDPLSALENLMLVRTPDGTDTEP
jgi:hypothetical protein